MDKLAYLKKVDLFRDLSDQELKRCEVAWPMTRANAGQLLYTPTDHDEALYVIKEGAVRLYRLSPDGREVTVGTLGQGHVFGTLPLFGSSSQSTFAEAATEALVCRIGPDHLRNLVQQHPDIALRLLRIVGERLASVEDQVEDLAFRSAEQRVARAVLKMCEQKKSDRLIASHEEIAKSAGVARETVTKILKAMEREGWVKTGYRRLRVIRHEEVAARAADRSTARE